MAYTISRSAGGLGISGASSATFDKIKIYAGRLTYFNRSIEKINRAGLSEEVLKRLAARRPIVDDSGEADFRFGGPSRFELVNVTPPTQPGYNVNTGGGPDEEEEVPPEAQLLIYPEVYKEMEEVRVENPEDAEQYIITKRRTFSIFLSPEGNYLKFEWDNSDLGGEANG